MRGIAWLEPRLQAKINYSEMMQLRFPPAPRGAGGTPIDATPYDDDDGPPNFHALAVERAPTPVTMRIKGLRKPRRPLKFSEDAPRKHAKSDVER
jgi:hypothetical protein